MLRSTLAWALCLGCGFAAVGRASAQDSLELTLLKQSKALIQLCESKGYANVGVLKFVVNSEGEKKFRANFGTLNLLLAQRLEMALVLANNPLKPVGILHNASAVAQTLENANHFSPDARTKLFEAKYPLAWGKDLVKADAFFTGTASVSTDRRSLRLNLYVLDAATKELKAVVKNLVMPNRAEHLVELGESFSLRGAGFDNKNQNPNSTKVDVVKDRTAEEVAFIEAVEIHEKKAKHPAEEKNPPVKLHVFYDGKQVKLEFADGQAYIPEPAENQKVHFELTRDQSDQRYAVVIKVNGENVLERETRPDLHCQKWVLPSNEKHWKLRGYYVNGKVDPFKVLSQAQSEKVKFNYGPDVGTISMTVFREATTKKKGLALDDYAVDEEILKQLPAVTEAPKNFHALKATLEDMLKQNRGLIVPSGEAIAVKLEADEFVADPTPLECWTIHYYQAK